MRTFDRILLLGTFFMCLFLLAKGEGWNPSRLLPSSVVSASSPQGLAPMDVSDLAIGQTYVVQQQLGGASEADDTMALRYYWVREDQGQQLILVTANPRKGYKDGLPSKFVVIANPLASQGNVRATIQAVR